MSRSGIDYDDIWREVESENFRNSTPSSKHDKDSVRGWANLVQEGLQMLRHPGLSQTQKRELKDTVQQAKDQLVRECKLAGRVGPI